MSNLLYQTSIYQHAPGVILRVTQTHLWLWTLRDSEGVNDSVWLLKRHTESFCKVSVIWLSMREEHQIKDPTQEKHRPVYRDIWERRIRELQTSAVLLMAHKHHSLFLCHRGNTLSGYLPGLLRPLCGKTWCAQKLPYSRSLNTNVFILRSWSWLLGKLRLVQL